MDTKTTRKLLLAFWNGYEIPDACIYVGIAQDVFQKAVEADEEFAHRMARAQLYPENKARHELVRRIAKGDGRLAMQYLQRREPERYDPVYIRKFGRGAD